MLDDIAVALRKPRNDLSVETLVRREPCPIRLSEKKKIDCVVTWLTMLGLSVFSFLIDNFRPQPLLLLLLLDDCSPFSFSTILWVFLLKKYFRNLELVANLPWLETSQSLN